MRVALKNTLWLSTTFLAAILCGLATAKTYAATVGPAGYGRYAVFTSALTFLALVADTGVNNALTRFGSEAYASGNDEEWESLRICATQWVTMTSLVLGVAVIALRTPGGLLVTGKPLTLTEAALLAAGVFFSAQVGIRSASLKSVRRLAPLAQAEVVAIFAGTAITILALLFGHMRGILPAIVLGGAANWLALGFGVRRAGRPMAKRTRILGRGRYFSILLQYGPSVAVASAVGSLPRTFITFLVLHLLGLKALGLYTTAMTVGFVYIGFLGSAMGRDYFPRVAAIPVSQRAQLQKVLEEQQWLVILLALPTVLGMLTLSPFVLPLVYSKNFVGALPMLRWVLAGDLFRFVGSTFLYMLMAHASSRRFVALESTGSALYMAMAVAGVLSGRLVGLGAAYAAYQALFCGVAYLFCRHDLHLAWPRRARIRFGAAILVIAVASMVAQVVAGPLQVILLGCETVAVMTYSVAKLRQLWVAGDGPVLTALVN